MKNVMGVEMSPRAERIYSWLAQKGTGIHQFSTDQCVQNNWNKLCELRDLLEKAQNTPTEPYLDNLTLQQVQDMAVDLRNIMRRLPKNRVDSK